MTDAMEETDYVFAIDPGTINSGIIVLRTRDKAVITSNSQANNHSILLQDLPLACSLRIAVVIEMMDNYGMTVGETTFKTLVWIGRFYEAAARINKDFHPVLITRRNVKLHLCNDSRAKDTNVRQACLNRYAQTGGGKTPEIGTKAQPGPLYGVKGHAMQALGLGLTFIETDNKRYVL